MAAAGAITLAWKGRAAWEPSEQDISRGPQKVSGLLAAVAVAVLWASAAPVDPASKQFLIRTALTCGALSLVFLSVYGFLVSSLTFNLVTARNGKPIDLKVIGGFLLTPKARRAIEREQTNTQKYFEGTAYDMDEVWTRPSRAFAKQTFVLAYVGLIVCGTLALAAAALLLSAAVSPSS
jgi:hypothetical protein